MLCGTATEKTNRQVSTASMRKVYLSRLFIGSSSEQKRNELTIYFAQCFDLFKLAPWM